MRGEGSALPLASSQTGKRALRRAMAGRRSGAGRKGRQRPMEGGGGCWEGGRGPGIGRWLEEEAEAELEGRGVGMAGEEVRPQGHMPVRRPVRPLGG